MDNWQSYSHWGLVAVERWPLACELRLVQIDPETVVHCGTAEAVTINLSHTYKTAEDFARAMNADAR